MVVRLRLAVSLVALAAICGSAAAPAASAPPPRSQDVRLTALSSQLVSELNATRSARRLPPLRISAALASAAEHHSRDMTQKGYFEHRSADGTLFWRRVARFYPQGKFRMWSVGENLLWSSPDIDAAEAVRLWMASRQHRQNMLNPTWREIGIAAVHVTAAPGFYEGLEVTVVTADFGVRR